MGSSGQLISPRHHRGRRSLGTRRELGELAEDEFAEDGPDEQSPPQTGRA